MYKNLLLVLNILFIICIMNSSIIFAQDIYIPDDNFEKALIDLGFDEGELNDSIPLLNVSSIKVLELIDMNISDLTGIENFTALEELYCQKNDISELNLIKNTKLNTVYCFHNKLTSLDVTSLSLLQYLMCDHNDLEEITFGDDHSELISIRCNFNKLQSIDLTNLEALRWLLCNNNSLNELNVSHLKSLAVLICSNNQLVSLNVKNGNNANMRKFYSFPGIDSRNNPDLNCIEVDNVDDANEYTDWEKDNHAVYSEDCINTGIKEEKFVNNFIVYPNPFSEKTKIKLELEYPQNIKIDLYDALGVKVKTIFNKEFSSGFHEIEIDGSDLENGAYFYHINAENFNSIGKVILMK